MDYFLSICLTSLAAGLICLFFGYQRRIRRFNVHKLSRHWQTVICKDGTICNTRLHSPATTENLTTAYQCLQRGVGVSSSKNCLGRIANDQVHWMTYDQVLDEARSIGRYLKSLGLPRQAHVGIHGAMRAEWLLAELGCITQSLVIVPFYDALGVESIGNMIQETEMAVLFLDTEKKIEDFLKKRREYPTVKALVLLQSLPIANDKLAEQAKQENIVLVDWAAAVSLGQLHPCEDDPPKPDDVFIIVSTSSTTGLSKGVIHTHAAIASGISGQWQMSDALADGNFPLLRPCDRMLCCLPMAHAYGQHTVLWALTIGAEIAVSSGNPQRLLEDMQISRPTFSPLVPRLAMRIKDRLEIELKSALFYKMAYLAKKRFYWQGYITQSTIWDQLVFAKAQKLVGGRLRYIYSAGALLDAGSTEFLRIVLGIHVMNVYGQSETAGYVTTSVGFEGNIGKPLPTVQVKLMDVPELNYFAKNNPPQGEMALKGEITMKKYLKRQDLTEEAFTPDGWLLTGDIAEMSVDGSLKIIDRRKSFFKLSQGVYIAPQKIESVYVLCPYVSQVYVDGNSNHDFAVAIVVPQQDRALAWGNDNAKQSMTFEELCSDAVFVDVMLAEMQETGKSNGLNSLEQVRAIHLTAEPFTVANGMLTATMKNRSLHLRNKYRVNVDELYTKFARR